MKKVSTFLILACALILALFSCEKEPEENLFLSECDTSDVIVNVHEIEGYSDKESYFPGDSIHLKIHSTTNLCNIEFIRHGAQDVSIQLFTDIPTTVQNYHCRSYSYGCNWETTFSYQLPAGLTSGIYSAELTNNLGEIFHICFVVKGTGTETFAVIANTNTWEAYNDWTGHSFYRYGLSNSRDRSEILSFNRPNVSATPVGNRGHLTEAELHLLRWMETNNYDYHVISDRDIHDGIVDLANYQTVVLNVHPEYWTSNMQSSILNFIDGGGNILNLGANCIYWKTVIEGHQIEKVLSGRSYYLHPGEPGGIWRDLGAPESAILGVEYDRRGYDTYHDYIAHYPSHWIFAGTGLSNGDHFGDASLNGGAASGHETDKQTGSTPQGTVLLAKGTNPDEGGASMIYLEHYSGSKVFSAGSITFTGSLSVDSVCHRIAVNVFDDFQN